MQAVARLFVAATLAFTLSVPVTARAEDHSASQSSSSGFRRPRAVCGPFGCYVYPRRGRNKAYRGFRMFLGFGGFSLNLSINSYSPYYGYGGYGGYYPRYGYGGYGGGYGPYRPGDYRNAYAGLFGRYAFPPAF